LRKEVRKVRPILNKISLYADLVKFEHTIFALPFALSALLMASGAAWPLPTTVLWVILTMVGGRTYAMGLNRIIDYRIDAANPRTRERALPAGRVQMGEAWALTLLALILMCYSAFQLPTLCGQLLPIAIAILTFYSFVKRFSNMAHLVLGLALGSSAIGGWIAITGKLSMSALFFGMAVLFWVAGFDIIYACQDVTFDREYGLFSIPASWGIRQGLFVSRIFHFFTCVCLVLVGLSVFHAGPGYWLAVLITVAMLIYEHSLVSDMDLSRVNEAFFRINGLISIAIFLLIALDKILKV
jgi:4-hydroxybenzoate polyprenyltransferase